MLKAKLDAYATAIDGDASSSQKARTESEDAWRAAFLSWQRIVPLGFGPTGIPATFTGGMGLGEEIDSWPLTNACRIDQLVADEGYTASGFPANQLVTVYGLGALEYLLFRHDTDNACAPQAAINQNGSWSALGEETIRKRRVRYAAVIAATLVLHARTLADAWAGDQGFAAQLARAGESGSPFASPQDAVNELFAALLLGVQQMKDDKLAAPAGISAKCTRTSCPELLESLWAGASAAALRENARGVHVALLGDEEDASSVGFDEWLVAAQAPELAQDLTDDVHDMERAVEAIPELMEEALAGSPDTVNAAHASVKRLADLLKSQFLTTLNLAMPQEGAADND